ncbi:unnamed protein product [Orchesella dallaii]|uniref:Uncharacterized protein n=1 Tax=Orchesella dallaii TaxID=48710 RepID=A0ABP1QFI5_9HEXA
MSSKSKTKMVRKGLPEVKRETKGKRATPGIVIDTECKAYAMIIPPFLNRPQKKARRGRSSKSKTPVPPQVDPAKVDAKVGHDLPPALTPVTTTPSSRRGSFTRKRSEALGVLNKIENPTQVANSKGVVNEIKRPKRKRLVDEHEIAAENIPLEAVFPVLQFGLNKDMCPKKKRRLQGLMSPRN